MKFFEEINQIYSNKNSKRIDKKKEQESELVRTINKSDKYKEIQNIHNETILLQAINNKQNNVVAAIISKCDQRDYYLNQPNFCGDTPLHKAIEVNDEKSFQLLISKGANINAQNDIGYSVIQQAILMNRSKMTHDLLECDADIFKTNLNGDDAIFIAASLKRHIALEYIFDLKKNQISFKNALPNGSNFAHIAGLSSFNILIKKMQYQGIEIDYHAINNYGDSPLHVACKSGNKNLVAYMLDMRKTETINFRNNEGYTPLHLAVKGQYPAIITLLLQHGADQNKLTNKNENLLILSCKQESECLDTTMLCCNCNIQQRDYMGKTALCYAIQHGHASIVKFLVKHNADVTQYCRIGFHHEEDDYEWGYIHHTVFFSKDTRCFEIISDLVNYGSDINLICNDITPLMLATKERNSCKIKHLLKLGAKTEIKNSTGKTALHFAIETGKINIVKILLPHADLNSKNSAGLTPLMLSLNQPPINSDDITIDEKEKAAINYYLNNKFCLSSVTYNYKSEKFGKLKVPISTSILNDLGIFKNKNNNLMYIQSNHHSNNITGIVENGIFLMLLEHNVNVNLSCNKGETALHLAVRRNNEVAVALLLEADIDHTILNTEKKSARELAEDHGYGKICALLKQKELVSKVN
ncbi:MAG: ankyrin repeat domain-containing protein [Pseudomonadota bacterium]|nr:ankyrin repeat domain-containing protein [Pseudomonadota bacterium]